jgi:iron complex outermembrane receptor protein
MKSLIIIFTIFLCVQTAHSQMTKESDTLSYKYPFEVIITAPRISMPLEKAPFAASIVSSDFLKTMPKTIAVDEALKLVPGVKVDNQADGERVHLSMRGQGILSERGIRGIKILLDGIPLNDPTGFTPDFYDVNWSIVKHIEVLRGPSASLYGGSSSAGIISIYTQDGGYKPLNALGFGSYGTYNFWKGLGQFGATVGKVNYNVTFSRLMGDGYRIHQKYWSNNIYGKSEITPTRKISITPLLYYTEHYAENAEGLNIEMVKADPKQGNPDAVPKNEYQYTKRFTGGFTGSVRFTDDHDIQFYGFGRRTDYKESVPSSVIHRTLISPGGSLLYTFHYGKKFVRNHFSIGGDYQYQSIDEYRLPNLGGAIEGTELQSDEKFKQTGYGVFAIDRVDIGKQWGVMLSARFDQMKNELVDNLKLNNVDLSGSKDFNKTTGRVGVTYSPKPFINIFANWGMGFIPPATEELAQNPEGYGGFNNELVSATSQGVDLGVRGTVSRYLLFDLTGFYMKTENDFDRYRIPGRIGETFYRNAAASKRFGLELYSKFSPVKQAELQVAYTYSNFKYDISEPIRIIMDDSTNIKFVENGNFLPNSPEHELYVDLAYEVYPGVSIGVSSETYSRSFIDGANIEAESVDPYSLFNARIVWDWKLKGVNGELSLQVRNMFDKKYIPFTEPDPGGNSYQPGPLREIFGGIKIGL